MDYSVLVIDDDEEDFILLSAHIKHCQKNVNLTYASTGENAIQLLNDGLLPNLILVDVQMPLMSGYDLLIWLTNSENWGHIPVVVWTGSISASEIKRYYQAGANSLMMKQDALQDVEAFCQHWFRLVQLP